MKTKKEIQKVIDDSFKEMRTVKDKVIRDRFMTQIVTLQWVLSDKKETER